VIYYKTDLKEIDTILSLSVFVFTHPLIYNCMDIIIKNWPLKKTTTHICLMKT